MSRIPTNSTLFSLRLTGLLTILGLLGACSSSGLSVAQVDADGDGFGSLATGGTDCDDDDDAVSPKAEESPYDGVDNDCDAETRDDDLDQDGFGRAFDCDDLDATVHQGATDTVGDGLDEDCDGADGADLDGDGTASLGSGGTDCDDDDPSVFPGAEEICDDGVVNDCDATEEEALADCALPSEIALLGGADQEMLGEQYGSDAGSVVDLSGDLDGDGADDLVIGAPSFDGATSHAGAAYVQLSSAGAVDSLEAASGRVVGDAYKGFFGERLSAGGDLDGDGLDDLVVGAPSEADGSGSVAVIYGPAVDVESAAQADHRLYGGDSFDGLGRVVATGGDLDGDGVDDLLIGRVASDTGTSVGVVELLSGAHLDMADLDQPVATFQSANSDSFGEALATGDVDGDGVADALVGAPFMGVPTELASSPDHPRTYAEAGAAYLFLSAEGTRTDEDADASFLGVAAHDRAGTSVSLGGDVDGDGLPDLLIGAIGESTTVSSGGAAYLVTEPALGEQSLSAAGQVLRGSCSGGGLGSRVDLRGDLNGDGLADAVVGTYEDACAPNTAANIYLSPMDGAEPDVRVYGPGFGTTYYLSLSTGDANGDGVSDLLIGTPYYADERSDAGAAWLIFGSGI